MLSCRREQHFDLKIVSGRLGVVWGNLGSSGETLGRLWRDFWETLGTFGQILGRFGEAFGELLGDLGGLGRLLEGSARSVFTRVACEGFWRAIFTILH